MQQCICDVQVLPPYIHDIQGKTVNMVCQTKFPGWYKNKSSIRKIESSKNCCLLLEYFLVKSVAKSFADNTLGEETVGTGCQLLFS